MHCAAPILRKAAALLENEHALRLSPYPCLADAEGLAWTLMLWHTTPGFALPTNTYGALRDEVTSLFVDDDDVLPLQYTI